HSSVRELLDIHLPAYATRGGSKENLCGCPKEKQSDGRPKKISSSMGVQENPGKAGAVCSLMGVQRKVGVQKRSSSRARGCPRGPLTPPYVRFRIRRFNQHTGVAAARAAGRPAP